MAASKLNRYWALTAILLVAIIVIGGIVAWVRYSPSQPIEISLPPGQDQQGRIYIGGAVTNAGFYPFTGRDRIEALIQAAGGTTSTANLNELKLNIPKVGEEKSHRKLTLTGLRCGYLNLCLKLAKLWPSVLLIIASETGHSTILMNYLRYPA